MLFFRRTILRLLWLIILILCVLILFRLNKTESPKTCKHLCPYSYQLRNLSVQFDSSHVIRHYPDFVCPQNFRNLADWIFQWPDQFDEHIDLSNYNGKLMAPCLPAGSIIYVRIWAINSFFRSIYPHLINKFVLITGEGDPSSPHDLEYLESPDSKIIHWFGQNGQYDHMKSKKFTHIPIGINCYEMADAIENIFIQQLNSTLPSLYEEYDEPYRYIQPLDVTRRKSQENLVLINFDPNTDGTGLRSTIWNDMCDSKNKETYSFVTCFTKPKGVQIHNMDRIYQRNRQYPFWLSPRGNGLDCHRTWEALYLDIIPIVWNSSLNILYENLPILIINDHSELNQKYLYEKLQEISARKLSQNNFYQYEKLRHAYWRRLILNKSRHKDIYQRKNVCWRAMTKHKA